MKTVAKKSSLLGNALKLLLLCSAVHGVQGQTADSAIAPPGEPTAVDAPANVGAALLELSEKERAERQARFAAIADERRRRDAELERIQSELGIYDPALLEAYQDYASFLAENEDFESALQLFDQALQIARINTGLYSAEQLPLIDAMIATYSKMEDWLEVDALQHLRYQVGSRMPGSDDLQRLDAVASFGQWQLRALREGLLGGSSWSRTQSNQALSEFYERNLARFEMQSDLRPGQLLVLVLGKSESDLDLARRVALTPFTAFQGLESQFITETRCRNVRTRTGQVVRECRQVQVENPRYRQSQRDAKNFELNRRLREVEKNIDRLAAIRDTQPELGPEEVATLESHIAELSTATLEIRRAGRRFTRF
jgi:hypothetical protein